jgi:hypothetical protein
MEFKINLLIKKTTGHKTLYGRPWVEDHCIKV